MRRLLVLAGAGLVVALAWLGLGQDDGAETLPRPLVATRPATASDAPIFHTEDPDEAAIPEALPVVAGSAPGLLTPAGSVRDLVLEIRHADGAPARGCRFAVASASGAEVLWSATTDDAGAARGAELAASEDERLVWVAGAMLDVASFALPGVHGRHVLVLPAGEVIDGRIVVDGKPPLEPVPLGLEPRPATVLRTLPQPLRQALKPFREGASSAGLSMGLLVGRNGHFAFSGLPSDWTGEFDLPLTYSTLDAQELETRAGERGRILHLRRVPHIRFRVVSAGERAPLPGAPGMVTVSGSDSSMSHGLVADAEGRVDITMLPHATSLSVKLALASPDGLQRTVQEISIDDPASDLDLGDVELEVGRTYPFRAVGPGGEPILEAIAAVECGADIRSVGTDASGLGLLKGVPAECQEMRVAAVRHETLRVALPPAPPAEPIEVLLEPCAWLELHVSSIDGAPRPGLELDLATERRVEAADKASRFAEQGRDLGVTVGNGQFASSREEHTQADGSLLLRMQRRWRLDDVGSFYLGCFEAGRPTRLRLEDPCGYVVWAADVVLARAEQRILLAELDAGPAALAVRVVEESGAPLAGVRVTIRAADLGDSESDGAALNTDAQGWTSLEGVYAPVVEVRCEKDGHARVARRVVPGGVEHVMLPRDGR